MVFLRVKLAGEKICRKMQHQLAAKERLATYESIMEASPDNSHMFFKLIKWQRDGGFN